MAEVSDFQPSGSEPIIHGVPGLEASLTRRTPESRERYYAEKIAELVMTQSQLAKTIAERDTLSVMLTQLVAAKDEKDSKGDTPRIPRDEARSLGTGT